MRIKVTFARTCSGVRFRLLAAGAAAPSYSELITGTARSSKELKPVDMKAEVQGSQRKAGSLAVYLFEESKAVGQKTPLRIWAIFSSQ